MNKSLALAFIIGLVFVLLPASGNAVEKTPHTTTDDSTEVVEESGMAARTNSNMVEATYAEQRTIEAVTNSVTESIQGNSATGTIQRSYSIPLEDPENEYDICSDFWALSSSLSADCTPDPAPEESSEPVATTETKTIVITNRYVAELMIEGSGITRQPEADTILRDPGLIAYTNPDTRTLTTTVGHTEVELKVTPASYTWDWGDDTTTNTTNPGCPYEECGTDSPDTIQHIYAQTSREPVQLTLTTTWTAQYRPAGTNTWQDVEGTLTTSETSTSFTIKKVITYLTDDAEEAQGH